MNVCLVIFCGFILSALPEMAKADDWIISPDKGSVSRDTAFSGEVGKESDSRGLDWGPWTALTAIENPDAVPTAGKHLVSPDQKFSVQTAIADSEFYFVIKNAQTGLTSRMACDTFPVLALSWSPDSKLVLAVVHEPMSSYIKLIRWAGSDWAPVDVFPPEGGDDDKYHVVGWEFAKGYVKVEYIVDHPVGNGESLNLYRCAFRVDPASGKISDVKKTAITQKEFVSLRNASN
jgi:hypothetical protein